jgi:glycosyltransferase involved in cell wall biosynthesis
MAIKSSALVPCRNTDQYIVQTLQSLLIAGFEEIVVYFDCCTDNSLKEAFQWKITLPLEEGSRIHLINGNTPDPLGVQDSRNLLFDQSSGDYVCFFDADDFYQNSVKKLIEILEQEPLECGGLITPCKYLFREPHYKEETYTEYEAPWMESDWRKTNTPLRLRDGRVDGASIWGFPPSIWYLLAKRGLQTGGVLWKRNTLLDLKNVYGQIWDPIRIGLQDVHLILDALLEGYSFKIYPEYSHTYRWGWNLNQITRIKGVEYQKEIVRFLHRLYEKAPQDNNLRRLIADEIYYAQKGVDELELCYEKFPIKEPEPPSF